MISHRLKQPYVTGYYEYLSQIRHRVNVAPREGTEGEETTPTTTNTSPSVTVAMDNHDTDIATNVITYDEVQQTSANLNDKDVTKWSSTDVERWVAEQCQKFELKKATTEKFQMNGQALVLLTKHDFLRRSPDGGEILYYTLQRLINPTTSSNTTRNDQNSMRNGSTRQNPRIVEISSDTDENDSVTNSAPSTQPIVEEPDDPPVVRKPDPDELDETGQHQQYPHSFSFNNLHFRQPVFTIPTAAYYQQQQAYPNAYAYGQHPHMQQQYFHPHTHSHPHFIHQYYPMMSAQGILIEEISNEEANTLLASGVPRPPSDTTTNGTTSDTPEQLYLVTMNGQRYIVNEEQIKQYAAEFYQQQQQQQFQQQQQYQQQQFQQQQHFHHHHQQQQQQQQQPPPPHFQRPQQPQYHYHHQQQPPPPSQQPTHDNGYYTT